MLRILSIASAGNVCEQGECKGSRSSPPGCPQGLLAKCPCPHLQSISQSPLLPSCATQWQKLMLPAFRQALLPSISLQSCSPCSTKNAQCGISSLPCFHPQAFGGYLRPAERMDIVLTALEAMADSSIYDKEAACSVMAVAMEDHAFWMPDVSSFWPLPHP